MYEITNLHFEKRKDFFFFKCLLNFFTQLAKTKG